MPDYEPTQLEKKAAGAAFLKLISAGNDVFKIGRCADDGRGGLADRDMYADAVSIDTIWNGSSGKVSWLEKWLIRYAWKRLKTRCRNEQEGGGGTGTSSVHHVYVVRWTATPELVDEIQLMTLLREIDELTKSLDEGED
ncbi:MAG: hypothetical protein ACHREM_26600 [Polyangiales bacterium]